MNWFWVFTATVVVLGAVGGIGAGTTAKALNGEDGAVGIVGGWIALVAAACAIAGFVFEVMR